MKILMISSIFISLSVISLMHPMSLGFILLSQTILISLIINMITYNFWLSYILFLIMIGGMLILFIYMTSIASNEKFKFSNSLMIFYYSSIMLMLMSIIMDNFLPNTFMINIDINMMNYKHNFNIMMNKFISMPNLMISITTIIYLLITLIAVVKISNLNLGPLRQMN